MTNLTNTETDSDWIGDIPDNWSLEKLKYIFSEKKSTSNSGLQCGSISFGKVIFKNDDKVPDSTKQSYQEVLEGEFLINPLNLNFDLKSLRIGLSKISVVVSQGYIVLKINDGYLPSYYEYLLRKFDVEHMKSLGQGVRQTISFTHIKGERLVVPPTEEQQLISRYLDKKTEQIDSLVEKIQKKIELLKEQRTSLINQCVTKGLDPSVEMKDSGIETIGEIPKHWDTKRLKYFLSYTKGFAFKSDVFEDEGIPIVRASDVKKGTINNPNVFLDPGSVGTYHKVILQTGDIIISTVGSQYSTTDSAVGQVAMVPEELDGSLLNQNTVFVRLTEEFIDRNFLFYTFLTRHFRSHLDVHSHGTANQASLNVEDILNYSMIFPGLPEQKEIVFSLERNLTKVDRSIDLGLRRTNLLREYRQSLISSVVTGKVRVTEDMI